MKNCRKRTEEALLESERRYREIFERMQESMFVAEAITDKDGNPFDWRYIEVNPASSEYMKMSREQLIGNTYRGTVPNPDQRWIDLVCGVALTGVPVLEERFAPTRGHWLYLNAYSLQPGIAAVIFTDITVRKEAENILKRYELLSLHSRDIILYIQQDDWRIIEANNAAVNEYGYSRDELLGMTIQDLQAPNTREQTGMQISEANEQGILFETMHRRKDGSIFPVEVSSATIDEEGNRGLISIVRNITKRKQAEIKLKASEKRYRDLFEATLAGVYLTHIDGTIINFNEATKNMLGFETREEVFQYNSMNFYADPEFRNELIMLLRRDGVVPGREATLLKKDGSKLYAFGYAVLLTDPETNEPYIQGMMIDITKRKQAEIKLKANEKRYRNLFEATLAGIYLTHIDGTIIDFNDATKNMLGYDTREEVFQHNSMDFYADPALRNELIMLLRRDGVVPGREAALLKKDGSIFYAYGYGVLLADPETNEPYIQGMMIDITDRKQAEDALRELKTLLETVVENTNTYLAYMDTDFNFIWVNKAYADGAKHDAAFFIGKNHFTLYPNEENRQIFRQVVETGLPVFIFDKPFEYPDQPERGVTWWNWSIFPVKDSSGQIFGIVLSLIETTEHHLAQLKIEQLQTEREAFLQHEVKNLLTPLQINISALRTDERLSQRQISVLSKLEKSVNRTNSFITQLKTITDLELGNYSLNLEPYPLEELIIQMIDELRQFSRQAGVDINYENQAGKAIMPLDRNFLPGVFSNLIRNAVEHVQDIEDTNQKKVRIKLTRQEDRYIIEINNCGIPIPPERIDIFFEKFNTGPEKPGGTGLGTSYAFLVTKAHGGNINVASNAEEGTTVTLFFPVEGYSKRNHTD